MSGSNSSKTMTGHQKSKNLIRSDCADIMVKVDKDVYHLDRLQLALKSDYFEKLFTEDYYENKCNLIKLPAIDSDTFSVVVDVIYDKDTESVITVENCVSLLMAMDYLQIKIDLKVYARFIEKNAEEELLSYADIIKLYHFISENSNFKPLLLPVFKYLSSHLNDVRGSEEFFSLPLEHFNEIILAGHQSYEMSCINEISQICVEWICYDWENRLPHLVKLVNAVKCRLRYPYSVEDVKFGSINLHNMNQEMKKEKILKYFQQLLFRKEKINTQAGRCRYRGRSNDFPAVFRDINMRSKLAKFLENGTLYDITVKVDGKTYRLHRFKLKSMSGYFAELISAELSAEGTSGIPIQSKKDKEYSLSEIDHKTFEMIINFIYLKDEVELTSDNILNVLKADTILRIEGLRSKCESWMTNITIVKKINTELAVEILNITGGKIEFEKFHKIYFREVVPVTWPEMAINVPLFSSVSFDMLLDILFSEMLHSSIKSYFCIDDQHKLLDICSKWVVHDVKNRYHLVPRIALAINCNHMVDYDDYKVETPTDFSICSEQHVRNMLWNILCSTSMVPSNETLRNTRKEVKEEPAFIFLEYGKIQISNAEFDIIESSSYTEEPIDDYSSYLISATMVEDNIFFIAQLDDVHIFFLMYNLSFKKLIPLSDIPVEQYNLENPAKFKLLNCCNTVYCICESGEMLKYSFQLNRWTRISKRGSNFFRNVKYTSDGVMLYQMYYYTKSNDGSKFVVNIYDFKQNDWISSPNLSLTTNHLGLIDLTFNGNDLVALFHSSLYVFNSSSQIWHQFSLPSERGYLDLRGIVTQSVNGILYAYDKLYNFSSSNQNQDYWTFIKELPSESTNHRIAAIHRPNVCSN